MWRIQLLLWLLRLWHAVLIVVAITIVIVVVLADRYAAGSQKIEQALLEIAHGVCMRALPS